ncbi:MAG: hypothetical protein HYV76_01135 [Candidatus Vogelbacteria bacterium]|nr:hypothetical protein [Candidatus Vogelbacteria bacterium]
MITVLKQLIRQIVPYLLFWIDPALIRAVCRVVIFILITITLVTPSITLAVFNQQINYQGKLTDSSNVAVSDGNYSIVFSLYTVSSGGSNVWTETKTVTVTNGLFSTMLGSDTALSSVDFNQTLYLGVKVGSDSEMTPRKTIGTVPAAFEADKLDGLDSLSFINSATTTLPNVWSMSGLGQVGSSSATTTALGNLAVIGTTIFNGLVSGYQQISAPFFTATSTTQASTFPLFTGTTATITNATTTTLFSTTASSTNLFTSNFTLC